MATDSEVRSLPPFTRPDAVRSRNMAAIRSKDTKPELIVRSALHKAGFRFVLRPRNLPGRADIVLPRYRHVVFVNGCFWHGHGCKISHAPKTNAEYWTAKIERNVRRHAKNHAALVEMGWKVTTVWECDLSNGISDLGKKLNVLRNSASRSLSQRPNGPVVLPDTRKRQA